jgi:hypothetical protein
MSYLRATSGASPLECAQLATVMHYAKVDVYLNAADHRPGSKFGRPV